MPATPAQGRPAKEVPVPRAPRPPDGQADWPEVLTAREVAAYLRVSYTMVLRMTRDGRLPAMSIGDTYRYHRAALDRLMDQPASHPVPAGSASTPEG